MGSGTAVAEELQEAAILALVMDTAKLLAATV